MGQQIELALRQSTHRVLGMLVSFLPGVVAFLVAVLVLALVGVLLAMLVRRILTVLNFDERLGSHLSSSSALTDWSPSHSPTLLASRTVLWLCIFIGIVIGISAIDASYAGNAQVSMFLLPYLTHIIGAILVLIVGNLVARFLARTVLIGAVNAQLQYARFLSLGIKWLVLVLTVTMALDHLGIGGTVIEMAFGILFGGIVLTLALAVGLGSRDLVTRSIERTMEKPPSTTSGNVASINTAEPPRPKLRHF